MAAACEHGETLHKRNRGDAWLTGRDGPTSREKRHYRKSFFRSLRPDRGKLCAVAQTAFLLGKSQFPCGLERFELRLVTAVDSYALDLVAESSRDSRDGTRNGRGAAGGERVAPVA